jgi:hypothetical protein
MHEELTVIGRMIVGIGQGLVYDANFCERSVWYCLYFVDICGHTLRRLRSNKMDYFADNAEQVQLPIWLSHFRREFTLSVFLNHSFIQNLVKLKP